MRTQIEADLLLQNLMLTADAMGLGAWIHASIAPPVLLGDPKFRKQLRPDARLRLESSRGGSRPTSCAGTCRCRGTPNVRANAVGLRHKGEHLIKAMCPPNYDSMAEAVDAVSPTSSARTASTPTRRCSSASTAASSAQRYLDGGQQLRRRRDRLHARHLHLHLRDPRPLPGALRHDPRARASGCRPTTSRTPTTRSTSATG